MTSVLHVAVTGTDDADGSAERPFRTINLAAAVAQPGDTVVVHAGEYREWVKPRRGGLSDTRRITYEAAAGEHVVDQGIGADHRLGPGGGKRVARDRAERAVRRLQPVRRGDRRRLDRLPIWRGAQAPRRRLPQRGQLLRGCLAG